MICSSIICIFCWTILFVNVYNKNSCFRSHIDKTTNWQTTINESAVMFLNVKCKHYYPHYRETTNKNEFSVKIATRTFITYYLKVNYLIYSFLLFIKHSSCVNLNHIVLNNLIYNYLFIQLMFKCQYRLVQKR